MTKEAKTLKPSPVRQAKENGLFTNELTDNQAIRLLKDAVKARKKAQYPNLPEHAIVTPNYEDKTANGLTRCIMDFLNSQDGCSSFRISNEGVMRIDKNGKAFRIKSSTQNGFSDTVNCVWGRFVSVEIKAGNDRQSEEQKAFQLQIENARGYYFIAKDFTSFLDWFNLKMNRKHGS